MKKCAFAVSVLALVLSTANATDSTSTVSTAGSTSAQNRIIITASGRYSCPLSALTDGRPKLTLCTAVTTSTSCTGTTGSTGTGSSSEQDDDNERPASVVCIPVSSSGSTGSTTSSGTGSTSTGTTNTIQSQTTFERCAIPTVLHDTGNLGRIGGLCVKGGSRTVTGGYDAATGKVDITITLTNCIDGKGAKHNGSAVMQGTITLKTESRTVYSVKDTKTIMDTVTFENGSKLIRSCTLKRDGEYDTAGNTFSGKSTRDDCVLDGQYKFKDGFVDSLIDNVSEVENF